MFKKLPKTPEKKMWVGLHQGRFFDFLELPNVWHAISKAEPRLSLIPFLCGTEINDPRFHYFLKPGPVRSKISIFYPRPIDFDPLVPSVCVAI